MGGIMAGSTGLEALTLSAEHAADLEERRRIPCELAAALGVVSRGKQIGFRFTRGGRLLYTKFRKPTAPGEKKSFTREPSGTPSVFWNLSGISGASAGSTLVITEGEFDAMSVLASGAASYVVSVPDGAQVDRPSEVAFTPSTDVSAFRYLWEAGPTGVVDLIPELAPFSRFILATDGDAKGRLLRDELAIRLGRRRCWFVTYPEGCKDANDVLVKHGEAGVRALINRAQPIVSDRLMPVSGIIERDVQAYSLGWTEFDRYAKFHAPELVVISGAPNAGKSQWALNVGLNLARKERLKGALIQAEDDDSRIKRDIIDYAREWRYGLPMDPEAWADAMIRVTAAPENISETDERTLGWLLGVIEEAATRHDCKWIIVDPWNEIEHIWAKGETETSYLNGALKTMRGVARTYGIILIIVAHPTKGIAGKSIDDMSLYDVSGSTAWANKPDHGFMLKREDNDEVTIRVAKVRNQRIGGHPGIATFAFNRRAASFTFVRDGA